MSAEKAQPEIKKKKGITFEKIGGVLDDHKHGKILYETVYQKGLIGTLMFACWSLESKDPKVFYVPELLDKSGIVVIPPTSQINSFQTEAFITASEAIDYASESELWKEGRQLFEDYLVAPSHILDIMAWFPLYYAVWDFEGEKSKFRATIYQIIKGRYGSGKNRYLELFQYSCLRTLYYVTMPRETTIFRIGHDLKPLMLFDELYLNPKSPEFQNFLELWNAGIKKGGTVPRQIAKPGGKGFRTVNFDVFFPKIAVFQERLPPGSGLSRSIVWTAEGMEAKVWQKFRERDRGKDPFLNLGESFYERAEAFRNKLLMYRFKKWNTLEYTEKWVKPDKGSPRRGQVAAPLYSVIADKKEIEKIDKYLAYQEAQRLGQDTNDVEEAILKAMYERLSSKIVKERIYIGDIASLVNEELHRQGIEDKVTPQRVSKIIREKFVIDLIRHSGGRQILCDLEKLKTVAASFGIDFEEEDEIPKEEKGDKESSKEAEQKELDELDENENE